MLVHILHCFLLTSFPTGYIGRAGKMMCVTKGCQVKDHKKYKADWRSKILVLSPFNTYVFITCKGTSDLVFASYGVTFESIEGIWDKLVGDKRLMVD